MKTALRVACVGSLFAVAAMLAVGADDAKDSSKEKPKQKVEYVTMYRSADLAGMPVRNSRGEDLGNIDDLVMEISSGDVRYAVLSFGGTAGLGSKLFAVPWRALTFKYGEKDRSFLLEVPQAKFAGEGVPAFEKNRWPDLSDPRWAEAIDLYYQLKPKAKDEAAAATKQAKEDKGADKPTKKQPEYAHVYRMSLIKGLAVRNDKAEDLGKVEDIVLDVTDGKVRYAAISFGGFLGVGDKLFAIPWDAFKFRYEANDKYLVLNIDQAKLKAAPGFENDRWPNTADPRWSEELDKYYEFTRKTVTRPAAKE